MFLALKRLSECVSQDCASADPSKDQENLGLEHRFCTSHPLHAECETYARAQRFLGLLEGPRRRRRGKCKTTHFSALKHCSRLISAVHPRRTLTEFSISGFAKWRIYIYKLPIECDAQNLIFQKSSAAEITFRLTFIALKG